MNYALEILIKERDSLKNFIESYEGSIYEGVVSLEEYKKKLLDVEQALTILGNGKDN